MTPCRTTAVWLWLKHGLQSKISLVKSHDLFNTGALVLVFSYCLILWVKCFSHVAHLFVVV